MVLLLGIIREYNKNKNKSKSGRTCFFQDLIIISDCFVSCKFVLRKSQVCLHKTEENTLIF